LDTPSNGIKLGYDIKRMIAIKIALSGMSGDLHSRKEAKLLLESMRTMWSTRVTKLARVVLDERKFNRPVNLPKAEDIQMLAKYLKKRVEELNLNDTSYRNYASVVETVMARLLLYNRRRSGELEATK